MNISNKSSQSVRKAHIDAEPGLSSLVNEVLSADTRAKIAANMTPEEIKELIASVRMYEIDHMPDCWPSVKTQELTKMADAIEQLQIEADTWRRKSDNERNAFASLLHCSYRDPKCQTIEDALLRAHIEAEHWREAYYDERAKYLNLISNK